MYRDADTVFNSTANNAADLLPSDADLSTISSIPGKKSKSKSKKILSYRSCNFLNYTKKQIL